VSPFRARNLRLNPFGACLRHERGLLLVPEIDVAAVAAFVRQPGRAVHIMGPPGHGKTSHLYAIHERFPGATLWLLREGEGGLIDEASIAFVDECQRLRSPFRRDASYVVTASRSVARGMRRVGLEVRDVRLSGLDMSGLARYVALRMEWARDRDEPLPEVPPGLLLRLASAHGGDVRAIESALYDWLQGEVAYDALHSRAP
jgi:hypothetical protein